ncbi:oxidoreductase [Jatrophihabitans sp. YIM 134969]
MPRFPRALLVAALAGVAAAAVLTTPASAAPTPSWELRDTGTTNHFRGLAPVSGEVAWISGYDGQVLRTLDGGATWKDVSPANRGASALQFRDIEATDANHAVIMAAGSGTDSRLYVTEDGGQHWTLAYRNTAPAAFFDCMSFSDALHGLVMSDPVNGKFRILSTKDGGHSWRVNPSAGMPPALTGEAGFAASGQCLTTSGDDAWFGSGGVSGARIFHSTDGGRTWEVRTSSLRSTESGGVFGLAFSTPSRGVAVGGDFAAPTAHVKVAATQLVDGPWKPSASMPSGYRSGVTFVPGTLGTVLAVGLTGSDVSYDGGRNWTTFDTGQFDTVSCAGGTCWAAGDLGRVGVLQGL